MLAEESVSVEEELTLRWVQESLSVEEESKSKLELASEA
jgi:hypothetical protein